MAANADEVSYKTLKEPTECDFQSVGVACRGRGKSLRRQWPCTLERVEVAETLGHPPKLDQVVTIVATARIMPEPRLTL